MSYSYSSDLYSDLHKDVYGFRPRGSAWTAWISKSEDEKQAEWDRLVSRLDDVVREQEEEDALAAKRFEELVAKTIQSGAGDRETALRWIMDASDCDGDWEFLSFHHHLPYGYFKQSVDLCAQV